MSEESLQPAQSPSAAPRSHPLSALAFRFCFVYFSLYICFTQMLGTLLVLPVGDFPELGAMPPMRSLVTWVARRLFGVSRPLVVTASGSGDKIYDWVQVFCVLSLAILATLGWTAVARNKGPGLGLRKWFRLLVRFAVSATMISYGMVKAIPLQMPAPQLTRLVEPYGNFSPMGVLWYSIGAAPAYESFAGCAELLAGVLLFLPRTALLGALVCLADSIQIFALNMTYDIPVKLFSFHLILLSLFLLAPEAPRLVELLLLNRPAGPSLQPPLMATRRGNRLAVLCQAVLGAYLFAINLYSAVQGWQKYGGGAVKSPLYGIWNVTQMSIDGQIRSPLLNDYDRWRRVIFQTPTAAAFQRMDDTITSYNAAIDPAAGTIKLTKPAELDWKAGLAFLKPADPNWKAGLTFLRPAADQLVLDGEMDGHRLHMQLELFDRQKFLLVSRGFNWIQEYPFNR